MAQVIPGTTTFLAAWAELNRAIRITDALGVVDADDTQDEVVTRFVAGLEAQRAASSTSGLAWKALALATIESMSDAQIIDVWERFAALSAGNVATALGGMLTKVAANGEFIRMVAGVPDGVAGSNYTIAND